MIACPLFAIGIGKTYLNELQCIASDQQYVFTSTDFDSLIDILTDVTDTVKTGKIHMYSQEEFEDIKGVIRILSNETMYLHYWSRNCLPFRIT
jgi:hypothetical protein